MCFICRLLHPTKKKQEEYKEPESTKHLNNVIPFVYSDYPKTNLANGDIEILWGARWCSKCGREMNEFHDCSIGWI